MGAGCKSRSSLYLDRKSAWSSIAAMWIGENVLTLSVCWRLLIPLVQVLWYLTDVRSSKVFPKKRLCVGTVAVQSDAAFCQC